MAQSLAVSTEPRGSLARTVIAGVSATCWSGTTRPLRLLRPTIAHQFFPREDELAALMGTFGVFATGFLMRPLGGLLFGHIGDRVGRKRALELSVLLMAVSTTILGLSPTYAAIGVWSPLLLTAIRLFQGLSIGGEYVGSMSFLAEQAPPGRRGFIGSWSGTSVVLGSLLGSGTAAVCTGLLSESQLASWGWRVPSSPAS